MINVWKSVDGWEAMWRWWLHHSAEEQHHFFALLTTQDANEIKWHEYGISFGDASCNMDFPSLGCVINLVFEVSIIPM